MKFLAFLKDSLRETIDKKSFWVLGIISLLFVLFCFSMSFEPVTPEEGLKETVKSFNTVISGDDRDIRVKSFHDLTYEIKNVQVLGKEAGHYEDGFQFLVRPEKQEPFFNAVRLEAAILSGKIKHADADVPSEPNPPPVEHQIRFLRKRFMEGGYLYCEVIPAGDGFAVRAKAVVKEQIRGGFKFGVFFGAYENYVPGMSIAMMVFLFQTIFAELVAGFFGVLAALIFTAFFIPSMLEKGNIEILLSKPVSRPVLLIYKYLGGLLYVLLLSTILIGGSWLGLSLRSGYWNPTYLWSIATLTFHFAILYAVSLLFGVLWRSWIGSIMMTAFAWLAFWAVGKVYETVHSREYAKRLADSTWVKAADAAYYVLPKPSHLGSLNVIMLAKSHAALERQGAVKAEGDGEQPQSILPAAITWELVIFSSLGFIIVMLGLSCWRFSVKDY